MYANQGEVRLMFKTEIESIDIVILGLAQNASTDTEYTCLITAVTNGSSISGQLSDYRPIAEHMTVAQYKSGQLIVTNAQKIVIPKVARRQLLEELHLFLQSESGCCASQQQFGGGHQ